MMKEKRYVAVEIQAFGQGMQKLFAGVAEVFSAIGAEEPEQLIREKKKWNPSTGTGYSAETNAAACEGDHTPEQTGSENADPDGMSAADTADAANAPENTPPAEEQAGSVDTAADEKPAEEKKAAKKTKAAESSVSRDDLTRIIVQKIKQNRSNNEKIGQLLKAYGAVRVGELPSDKYEAFITDLAAI